MSYSPLGLCLEKAIMSCNTALSSLQKKIRLDQKLDWNIESKAYQDLLNSGAIDQNGKIHKIGEFFSEFTDYIDKGSEFHIQFFVNAPGENRQLLVNGNSGHSWLEMGVTDDEGNKVTRSIGFYPETTSDIQNMKMYLGGDVNSKLQWDINGNADTASTEIKVAPKDFKKMLQKIVDYDSTKYDLDDNNCTDFVIQVGKAGGINLTDTYQNFPYFGKSFGGTNPADLSEDLLNSSVNN